MYVVIATMLKTEFVRIPSRTMAAFTENSTKVPEQHMVSLINSVREIEGQLYQNPFLCYRRAVDSGPGPGSPVV